MRIPERPPTPGADPSSGAEAALVSLPGGAFRMGSDRAYAEERPARRARVAPFAIDARAVSNARFAAFVRDTGYLTTAERVPDRAAHPGMPDAFFQAGSSVFRATAGPVPLDDYRHWWHFVPGASWRAPEGPGSDLRARADHPVVHVSLVDAVAYADWAGLALPDESQWEYAASTLRGEDAAPGHPPGTDDDPRINTWRGAFPWRNDLHGAGPYTVPVDAHPADDFGLHGLLGNVWEWTTSRFDRRETPGPAARARSCCTPGFAPDADPATMYAIKGGSFLCSPSYCRRYRPAARSPLDAGSSMSHVGFRCVSRPD